MNKKVIVSVALVAVGVFGLVKFNVGERVGFINPNSPEVNTLGNMASTSFGGIASASSTKIMNANTSRLFAICTNVGPQTLWLGFSSRASISGGIALLASQSYTINANNLYQGAIWARTTSTTTGKVACLEQS